MPTQNSNTQKLLAPIQNIITHNGPNPAEYEQLSNWFDYIKNEIDLGNISKEEKKELQILFGEVISTNQTIFGHGYNKPHTYPEDYEILKKIYYKYFSSNPRFIKFDLFSQQQACSIAIRNRKAYFKELLVQKSTHTQTLSVLNLGSGSCQGIKELLDKAALQNTKIHCVDLDKNAVLFAQYLLESDARISFEVKKIFNFLPQQQYDLIWSAGLFNYFDDVTYVRILERFLAFITDGGEIVIGNFHPANPSKSYMEFGEWYIHHRTAEELIVLAQKAGVKDKTSIMIDKQTLGINLFMRIKK